MAEAQLTNADPAIEEPTPEQLEVEYAAHTRTYNGFVHMCMWFIFHIPLLLLGIYAMTLGNSIALGVLLIIASFAVLGYGIMSMSRAST